MSQPRIARVGVWRGKIAEVEGMVYPAHAADTAEAQRLNVDIAGPYAVLEKIAPPSTRDTGGGR